MRQPDWLKTDAWVPWSNGPGNDVWAALTAAWTGDLPTLQRLIAAYPELRHCDEGYREPITLAILAARADVVAWLLQGNPDTDSAAFGILPDVPQRAQYDPDYAVVAELVTRHQREVYGVRPEGEQLAELIRQRDVAAVAALIDADLSLIEAADGRGNQPLHWAALTRNLAMIDLLLERGAAIDARRPDGARPIEVAFGDYHYRTWYREKGRAMASWHAVAGYLLARGAEYDLVMAAHLGDVERVEQLVSAEPELANALPAYVTYYSGFPLRVAAGAGHVEVVEVLLARGADPNRCEPHLAPWGGALHAAAGKGHRQVCELLLAAGANLDQEIESSGNVVTMAGHYHHLELQNWLLEQGAKWPYWHLARHEMADELAARLDEDPEGVRDIRNFAEAAQTGNRRLRELFLSRRPDCWEVCEPFCGPTPQATAELLVAGLDPCRASWVGITMAHELAGRGDLAQLEVFVAHGADLEAVDDASRATPLGWAARRGQAKAVRYLLDQGADPNGGGAGWSRPLAWVADGPDDEIGTMLRRAGAALP